MSRWKSMKKAMDTSATKFLENRRFSREKREFTWDWHAWNLVIVTAPLLVVWAYLHRIEQIIEEESRIREAIQEETGVGSRGYMVPRKKDREIARGLLRKGHLMRSDGREKIGSEGVVGGPGAVGSVYDKVTLQRFLSNQRALQQRLDAIETKLGLEIDPSLRLPERIEKIEATAETSAGSEESAEDGFTWENVQKTANKIAEAATASGQWITEVGVPEGKQLYDKARAWIKGDSEDDQSVDLGDVAEKKGVSSREREVAESLTTNPKHLPDQHASVDGADVGEAIKGGIDSTTAVDAAETHLDGKTQRSSVGSKAEDKDDQDASSRQNASIESGRSEWELREAGETTQENRMETLRHGTRDGVSEFGQNSGRRGWLFGWFGRGKE